MRAYSAMLGALSKPETSATRRAPAARTCPRFSIFIPPMQKIGSVTAGWEHFADWKRRLWRSLGDARCALIDASDLTPFVLEEVRLCYHCLGPRRSADSVN